MMYKTFKYSHGKEKYTEILPEHLKKALIQFRMGTYTFPVNNRKHFNVPRADRHRTTCDKSVMGDEIHFLNIMQTNDPETIGNLAKFILHGLKLYT